MYGEHPDPSRRERDIFNEALGLTPQERAALIERECGDNQKLRASVEAMLKNHADGVFFVKIAAGVRPADQVGEKVGDTIDYYKLLEVIGEGGFGVVYLAEQQEPFYRQVALKVIRLGMDTKQVISRFETERQALAKLEHSNIARVYDAGTTKTGRPYFVMELVRGKRITEFCDDHRLTIPQRLELFVKVCRAVQHAHDKKLVHRDIKPSNILVIEENDEPLPKVIDFGIAKTSDGEQTTSNTLVTSTGQIIGTLAYMSPEQAKASSREIDTRTDIYSLGVLLYELLTGSLPFNIDGLGQFEQLRTIIENPPSLPSQRFNACLENEKQRIANCRKIETTSLFVVLQGDIDRILMRCLEKNRDKRYEKVSHLAADIQCHLNTDPSKELNVVNEAPEKPTNKTLGKWVLTVSTILLIIAGLSYGILSNSSGQRRGEIISTMSQAAQITSKMHRQIGDTIYVNSDEDIRRVYLIVNDSFSKLLKIPVDSCPTDFKQLWSSYLNAFSKYANCLAIQPHNNILFESAEHKQWVINMHAAQTELENILSKLWAMQSTDKK